MTNLKNKGALVTARSSELSVFVFSISVWREVGEGGKGYQCGWVMRG
jgi:hypothetical protein